MKTDRADLREQGEKIARAAASEHRRTRAAAEHRAHFGALAPLQQNHGDQEDTNDDVQDGEGCDHWILWLWKCTMRAKASGSRLAPPTRAPSMSGCVHQIIDGFGLDGAPVLDPDAISGLPELGRQAAAANVPVDLLGDLRRRGAAGADRPDRLVGDDDLLGPFAGYPGQALAELRLDDFERAARIALLERFAHADDRADVV